MPSVAVFPFFSFVEEAVVHGELGDAAVGQALQEAQTSGVRVVDPQADARRQQHPERRDHPHEPRLAIGGVEHDDDQNQIRPLLVDDAEHDRTLLVGGAGRRLAARHPVAVLVFDRALRVGRGRRTAAPARSARPAKRLKSARRPFDRLGSVSAVVRNDNDAIRRWVGVARGSRGRHRAPVAENRRENEAADGAGDGGR